MFGQQMLNFVNTYNTLLDPNNGGSNGNVKWLLYGEKGKKDESNTLIDVGYW